MHSSCSQLLKVCPKSSFKSCLQWDSSSSPLHSFITQSSKVELDDWKNPEDCVALKKHSENRLPKRLCRVMRWSKQTYHSCGLGLHSQNSIHPNSGFSSQHPPLHDQDLQITMTSPSRRLVHSHGRGMVDIGRRCSFTIEDDVIKLDADIHQTWPHCWREPHALCSKSARWAKVQKMISPYIS